MRSRLLILGLPAMVVIAGFVGWFLPDYLGGEIDFIEYSTAARLLNDGQNPYDGELLLPLQHAAGWQDERAQMMWNPPWVFPLVLPLASMPISSGFLATAALQLGLVVIACVWLWRSADRTFIPIVLGIAFAPTIFLLRLGQSSGFLLLGLVAFATALRDKRPIVAGISVALTAFKPHLFFPFAALLLAESWRDRSTRLALYAGAVVLALASVFPLFFNSDVWQQFLNAIRAPGDQFHYAPSEWRPPILSARIADWTGGNMAVQFAPSIIGTAVLLIHWYRSRRWGWFDELPVIVLVCLLTTGYGAWGFDLVVLLVPIVDAARRVKERGNARLQLWAAAGFLALDAAMLTSQLPVILWTPVVALGYAAVRFLTRLGPTSRTPNSL